jgi:hypothetical protein
LNQAEERRQLVLIKGFPPARPATSQPRLSIYSFPLIAEKYGIWQLVEACA